MLKESRDIKRLVEELYPNCSDSICINIKYKLFKNNTFDLDRYDKIEEGYLTTPEWLKYT